MAARKIVIIPSFASSHFLKCWIPNIIEILEPNIIVINESVFPNGPENKGQIDTVEFRKKYHFKETNLGFDISLTEDICSKYDEVHTFGMQFTSNDVNECFVQSMTSFHGFEPESGDIIFTLEPDALLFEGDKVIIHEEISKLKPGQGLKCLWRDYLETQYYCEAINEIQPKHRRFAYCFDNLENYKKSIDGFMSQNYPLLQFTDKFWVRHYPWFCYSKWKELRYDLIYRSDPQYWKDFENGLHEIRRYSENPVWKKNEDATVNIHYPEKIMIRPSRQDEGRWAKFIDVPHPKHIQNHPNFVK